MKNLSSFKYLMAKINTFALSDKRIRRNIVITLFLTTCVAMFPTATSYLFSLVLNRLFSQVQQHKSDLVGALALGMMATQVIPILFRMVNARLVGQINIFVSQHFNFLYERKMAKLDYGYFDNPDFHDLIKSTREKGVTSALGLFTMQFDSIDSIVQIILASAVIATLGVKFMGILVAATIPTILVEIWKRKRRKQRYEMSRTEGRYANVYLREAGTRESRIFEISGHYFEKFKSISDGIIGRINDFENRRVGVDIGTVLFLACGTVYVIHEIFSQITLGKIQVGSAVFLMSSMWLFISTLRSLIALLATFYENSLYAEEFFEVMELPPLVVHCPDARVLNLCRGPRIEFDNVSFCYPGKEDRSLIDVSVTIESGHKVAFVGENGGGKSTMTKLLLRFYDPKEGRILIDGEDLRNINLENYRKSLGYVAQSPSIPNLSIRELLANGKDIPEPALVGALERSRSYGFVSAYKDGIDQQLGKMFKGGIAPSDGQRQRLAISRAYAQKPRVLIFDEPTADLDPETQNHVMKGFYQNNQGVTGILIVHSLQGVIDADKIFVFEKGRVSQIGQHASLLTHQGGWYAESFKKQFENVL